MEYYLIIAILTAIFTSSLQQDGDSKEIENKCHSPETYANTVCKLKTNETYPVVTKTKVECFCTFDGVNRAETMKMVGEENNEEIELVCLASGMWSRRTPICCHNSTKELAIQLITLENSKISRNFTSENMMLFPIFVSGAKIITLYITDSKMAIEDLGLQDLENFEYIEILTPYKGYPFSTSHWPFTNNTIIKENFKRLSENFQLEVFFKSKGGSNWTHVPKGFQSPNENNSSSKAITLNVIHGLPAVITGVKLQLTWDFVAESITVDGVDVDYDIKWNLLTFKYPKQDANTSLVHLNIKSSIRRYEWPLHNVTILGKNDLIKWSSLQICLSKYCHEFDDFKKKGRYFSVATDNVTLKLKFTSLVFIHEIQLEFYGPFDAKLKTTFGDVDGVHFQMKKNPISFDNIIFIYPEPVIIQSNIELTFESSFETSYWPIQKIELLGQSGNPNDWCQHLPGISRTVTTVDKCIHYAEENLNGSHAKVRLNYTAAAAVCEMIQGQLFEPRNAYLQNFIESNAGIFKYFWIGAKKENNSEEWQWFSGDSVTEDFFVNCVNNTEPNGTCVQLLRECKYKWISRRCNETSKYICQSRYIGCGYPHKKEITLMIEQRDGKFPLKAQYSCPEGFSLIGNDTRTCDNGRWSNEAPICEKYLDKGKTDIDTTTLSPDDSTTLCSSGKTDVDTNTLSAGDSTTINSSDPQLSPPVDDYIKIIASSVIGICSTASIILICISIILIYKRRKSNQQLNVNEALEAKHCDDSRNILRNKDDTKSVAGKKTFTSTQIINKRSAQHGRGQNFTEDQKPQQEMEMVESDIYDSIEPQNIMVDNDIYGTL